MTVIGEVFVAVRGQTDQFQSDLDKGVTPAAKRTVTNLAKILGGAALGHAVVGTLKAGLEELQASEAGIAQTAAAIKSTGGAANVTAEQVGALADQQLKLTGVDDEVIRSGENKLLTFTAVRNEVGKGNDVFNQATVAALDLSRAGFGSVESAAVLMGKALNDPVAGLTALQRVGVRLTDSQKETVKQLVATGDTLGAQKVILAEVQRQVGGSAEAFGKTLPGQLAVAQESLTNTKAELVSGMAPALKLGAGLAAGFTEQFAKQPTVLKQVEGGLLLVVGAVGSIATPLKASVDLFRSFAHSAAGAADATGAVADSAGVARVASEGLAGAEHARVASTTELLGTEHAALLATQARAGAEAELLAAQAGSTTATAAQAVALGAEATAAEGAAVATGQLALFTADLAGPTAAAAATTQQLALFAGEATGSLGTLAVAERLTAAAAGDLTVATRTAGLSQLGTDALNSASSVDTLYTKSGRLSGGLSGVKGAALGLGIQLGILYGAMQLIHREVDHANLPKFTKDLIDFTDGGKAAGELAGTLGPDFKTLQNAIEDIAKPSTGAQIANVVSTLSSFGTQHGVRGSLDKSRAVIDDLDASLTRLGQQDPKAAAAALDAISASLSPQDAERLRGLLTDYTGQLDDAAVSSTLAARGAGQLDAATGELTPTVDDASGATKTWADQLQDVKDQMDQVFTTTEDAISSGFAYTKATDRTSDAQAKLVELLKAGKGGSDEFRRAVDDAAEAMFGQAQAASDNAVQQYALQGATLSASDQAAIQKAELERLRDTLAPGNPLRARLDGMITQLGQVKSKEVTIVAHTEAAQAAFQRLVEKLGLIKAGIAAANNTSILYGVSQPKFPSAGGVQYRAIGGSALAVPGGPRGTDVIPAWLTPGEFVIQERVVRQQGVQALAALNAGRATIAGPGGGGGGIKVEIGQVVLQGVTDSTAARQVAAAFVDGVEHRLAERRLAVDLRALA